MKQHRIKTWRKFFDYIWKGEKTFELRYNDRKYAVGDILLLEEYNPHTHRFTGRWIEAYVTYLTAGFAAQEVNVGDDLNALGKGWVCMAFKECRRGGEK